MYSEKEKKYYIEREQLDAKGSIKIIKRDFFDDLPRAVCEVLDNISWRWRNYDWFEEAWNKYRDHVINSSANGLAIKAPGFIFNDYIDEQVKQDFLNRESSEILHSELDLTELFHHGVKGQKWGVRRFQNEDGTLTEEGKKRYNQNGSAEDSAKTTDEENDKKYSDMSDKEKDEFISKLKKENERNKVVDEYNNRISKQLKSESDATEKEFDNSINMIREGQNITSNLSVLARDPKKGSNRSNPKETKFEVPGPYSNLSDDELRKIVNRMQLERQYGDLSGDAKYTLTGREKTREYLQTIGALLGIGVSALTIYKLIQRKNNNNK